jgi:hypothetical protein
MQGKSISSQESTAGYWQDLKYITKSILMLSVTERVIYKFGMEREIFKKLNVWEVKRMILSCW